MRTNKALRKTKKLALTISFFLFFSGLATGQSLENLKEINKVWSKFYQAFDDLDHEIMAEIHSKKLIRISGGSRISDYATYINNYKITFDNAKSNKVTNRISLRFFERINNDSIASERGIYKLERTSQEKTQTYYGKFHVLFSKENGIWKILMDYDSNEANSIGEKDYTDAYGIDEFDKFIKP